MQRRIAFILTAASVLTGVWWGAMRPAKNETPQPGIRLTLLAPEGVQLGTVPKSFFLEADIQIEYLRFKNDRDLATRAAAAWDVALVTAAQMNVLRKNGYLGSWDRQEIENTENLAPDFQVSVMDPTGEFAIPLFWGVTDNRLWIENLVLSVNSGKVTDAHIFANFLLEPETAIGLSQTLNRSGVNLGLEKADLAPRLKPSHLKDLKRSQIKFPPTVDASF